MPDEFYLPKEEPNFVNFPELRTCKGDIDIIMAYALRANTALSDYNDALYDKIDLNMDEVRSHISLCRKVCDTLGTAPNVCFDALIGIREIQKTLQDIAFLKTKFGNSIVGTPTSVVDGGDV